jgi:hypothetical protein
MRFTVSLLALSCLILTFDGNAFAQATAEAALTHGLSSAAGSSLGKAMGNATGQLAGKLGQQTSSAVSRQRPSTAKLGSAAAVKPAPTTTSEPPASGSLILSVQGAASQPANCAPAQQKTETAPPKSDAPVTELHPAVANCVSPISQDADSHPAVLNLPAAK